MFHLGGLILGNFDAVPQYQISYLVALGFTVVVPNYRLTPQVSAVQSFGDCEDAYDWAVGGSLSGILRQQRPGLTLDSTRVVAMGHSTGGTMALHIASCKSLKAVTAFYPSLFLSDTSTSAHKPSTTPIYSGMPDYWPGGKDWAQINPVHCQVSDVALTPPGASLGPRNKWQVQLLKEGVWMSTIQPDGRFATIDPMTRLAPDWPPVMIVQGEHDNVPGSSLELAFRAAREMMAAGMENVEVEVVSGQSHAFDLAPGASGRGDVRWTSTAKGLNWLNSHFGDEKKPVKRRYMPQMDVHIRYER